MHMGRAYNIWSHSLAYELTWPIFSMLSAVVLFQLSFWSFDKLNVWIVNRLIHIGVCSFGIYLLHPFVLFIYNKLVSPGNALLFHFKIIAGFFIILVISWVLTGLMMKYVKWSAFLFGAAPKSMPYKK